MPGLGAASARFAGSGGRGSLPGLGAASARIAGSGGRESVLGLEGVGGFCGDRSLLVWGAGSVFSGLGTGSPWGVVSCVGSIGGMPSMIESGDGVTSTRWPALAASVSGLGAVAMRSQGGCVGVSVADVWMTLGVLRRGKGIEGPSWSSAASSFSARRGMLLAVALEGAMQMAERLLAWLCGRAFLRWDCL